MTGLGAAFDSANGGREVVPGRPGRQGELISRSGYFGLIDRESRGKFTGREI